MPSQRHALYICLRQDTECQNAHLSLLPITDYLIGNFHEAVTNGSKSLPGTSSDILSLIRVNEGFDIL